MAGWSVCINRTIMFSKTAPTRSNSAISRCSSRDTSFTTLDYHIHQFRRFVFSKNSDRDEIHVHPLSMRGRDYLMNMLAGVLQRLLLPAFILDISSHPRFLLRAVVLGISSHTKLFGFQPAKRNCQEI